jgi:hypothetical protein
MYRGAGAMKNVFPTVAMALFVVACSEPTAVSTVNNSLRISAVTDVSQDFEGAATVSGSWNPAKLETSPGTLAKGPTAFLGRFTDEVVSLSLPAGTSSLTISFDLYIIGSWDGAGKQNFGSDRWQIEVQRGAAAPENVFHTSFANQATKPQNYPRQVTEKGTQPAGTGAIAVNTLGYSAFPGPNNIGDATYHMSFTVSNPGGGAVTLLFHTTTPGQGAPDESWGLDNVSVSGN